MVIKNKAKKGEQRRAAFIFCTEIFTHVNHAIF